MTSALKDVEIRDKMDDDLDNISTIPDDTQTLKPITLELNSCEEQNSPTSPKDDNIVNDFHDKPEKNLPPVIGYDTLVLSGGSSGGIITLGGLQYAFDNYLLVNVKTYIGTSVGAIISYLLSIGFTPIEIIVYICTNRLLEKLNQTFNVMGMVNGTGAASFLPIVEQLEKMTISKIGYLPTMKHIQSTFGKTLVVATHNYTTGETVYIDPNSHPDMPCLTALRMSASLPLIFEKFRYGPHVYVDGGVSDNFPIDIGVEKGTRVLGIVLTEEKCDASSVDNESVVDFAYNVIRIPMEHAAEYKIRLAPSEKCTILKIPSKLHLGKALSFEMSSKQKLELFSKGYQQVKESLE